MHSNNPFPEAAPDFSDPLALLRACHQRIAQHCELLQRLARQLQQKGLDAEVTQAAGKVHRYFSTAARHHHDDEEQDLFPLLTQHSAEFAEWVHQLRQQHRQLDTLTQAILPLLAEPASIDDSDAFIQQAEEFAVAWLAHIRYEEDQLLDQATDIFTQDQLIQLGQRMAERRGIRL